MVSGTTATDLLERVRTTRRPRAGEPKRDLGTAGTAAWAAIWAAAVGACAVLAVVLLGWLADGRTGGSAKGAIDVGLQAFLLGHGGTLSADWGSIGLIPLGLTALPAWLLLRAGAAVARQGRRSVASLSGALGVLVATYAVLLGGLAVLAGSDSLSVSPWRAAGGAAVLSGLAGTTGALRVSGTGLLALHRVPGPRRAAASAVLAGGLTLLAGAAAVVAVALAMDLGHYAEVSRAVAPTAVGAVGLGLLGLLLLPNALLYATAAGVGPGFSVGRGTVVGAFDVHLDTVPALPLLAALPDGGTPPYATLLIPLLGGLAIGGVLVRRLDDEDERGVRSTAGWAALCGVACALGLGLASYAAGGPLGAGRLMSVGPSGWVIAGYAAVELAVVAAATAAILRYRQRRA